MSKQRTQGWDGGRWPMKGKLETEEEEEEEKEEEQEEEEEVGW